MPRNIRAAQSSRKAPDLSLAGFRTLVIIEQNGPMNGSDIYKKYRNMVPETKGLSYGGFFGTLVLFTEMGLIRKINHNSEPAKAIYKITRKGTEAIKDVRTFYTSLSQFGLTATKSAA